jgi:hypothetical protein
MRLAGNRPIHGGDENDIKFKLKNLNWKYHQEYLLLLGENISYKWILNRRKWILRVLLDSFVHNTIQ